MEQALHTVPFLAIMNAKVTCLPGSIMSTALMGSSLLLSLLLTSSSYNLGCLLSNELVIKAS